MGFCLKGFMVRWIWLSIVILAGGVSFRGQRTVLWSFCMAILYHGLQEGKVAWLLRLAMRNKCRWG